MSKKNTMVFVNYEKIKKKIDETGLSQRDFAKKIGMSYSTFRRVVYLEELCGFEKLAMLSSGLKMEIYELFLKD